MAASNSAQRRYLGPCLEIGPRASTPPDCLTRGHTPVSPQSLAGDAKRAMSPISEAMVNALIQPIPGAVITTGM